MNIRAKLILFIFLLCSLINAELYNFEATPLAGELFHTAKFRVNIQDDIEFVRGIYFYCPLERSDMRSYASDTTRFHCALERDFAIMGAQLDTMYMSSGIGDALVRALYALADSSGHDELAYSPLFLEGFSWGGQWAYHFTMHYPERVIGFCTQKGGKHDSTVTTAHLNVPGYMFIGENDADYRQSNLTGIFENHRAMGAVWALTVEPGGYHSAIYDRELLDTWFYSIVERRLPEGEYTTFPELIAIDEESGYLGNRDSLYIGHYNCYPELGCLEASWFPDRENAILWQNFVSVGTITDSIPCDSSEIVEVIESSPFIHENPFYNSVNFESNFVIDGIYDINGKKYYSCNSKYINWKPQQNVPSGIYFVVYQNSTKPFKIVYLK